MSIKRTTVDSRMARGMSREEAESTPLKVVYKLTIDKVLAIEKEGLSICSSAYALNVNPATLWAYIKRHKLDWRGKQTQEQKKETFAMSQASQCKDADVSQSAVYAQMKRNGLSFSDALQKVVKSKKSKSRTALHPWQSDFIMQNYKRMGCAAVAKELGINALRVKCRYNYVLYKQAKKGAICE